MSRQETSETDTDQVTVVFVCEWCGGRVELVSTEAGISVTDAREFLDAHAECLHRRAPVDSDP